VPLCISILLNALGPDLTRNRAGHILHAAAGCQVTRRGGLTRGRSGYRPQALRPRPGPLAAGRCPRRPWRPGTRHGELEGGAGLPTAPPRLPRHGAGSRGTLPRAASLGP